MEWANPGIERRLQSWLWRGHWATDGKPNSPSSLPYTTATMRVHAGRDSAPEPKITIIPSFLLREWKLLLFCFRYYFFGSYSFFLGIDIFFDESWRAFQKYQLFYKKIRSWKVQILDLGRVIVTRGSSRKAAASLSWTTGLLFKIPNSFAYLASLSRLLL